MERLTEREVLPSGKVGYNKCYFTDCNNKCGECEIQEEVALKLKAYEDAEEQGLLFRLPCPIGTTVYSIDSECEGDPYDCHHCCDSCACSVLDVYVNKFDTWMCEDFGKSVFLTKEEAEQKLAEIKNK